MNERIRECWIKAAREDSDEKWDTQEEFIERFAKLIVQECAEVVRYVDAVEIKRHFGLE